LGGFQLSALVSLTSAIRYGRLAFGIAISLSLPSKILLLLSSLPLFSEIRFFLSGVWGFYGFLLVPLPPLHIFRNVPSNCCATLCLPPSLVVRPPPPGLPFYEGLCPSPSGGIGCGSQNSVSLCPPGANTEGNAVNPHKFGPRSHSFEP